MLMAIPVARYIRVIKMELVIDQITSKNSGEKFIAAVIDFLSFERQSLSGEELGKLYIFVPNPECPISIYEFLSAAAAGAKKTVTKYIEEGGDIRASDECQRNALHRSSLYSQTEMTKYLLESGADPNAQDKLGGTALHWGCRGGSLELITILLNHGAKVNKKDNLLNTPLHVATRTGCEEGVNYLLECGAKINERDIEGDTVVHDAVRLGRHNVVKTLILHGADMNIKNKAGKTAQDMVQLWYKETCNALEKQDAKHKTGEGN